MSTNPRRRFVVLGLALFVYLTAELFPVVALPELSRGLDVSQGTTGLLLTAYAVAAGVATLPAVRLTRGCDRRSVLVVAMVLLAVSQAGFALAPTFAVAAAARGVGALAHGLLWSQVPVVAASFVGPERAGRAVAAVFVGTSLGLVSGTPLTTGLVQVFGWRAAAAVLGVAALGTSLALRITLPTLRASDLERGAGAATRPGTPWRPILGVCLVTVVLVVGNQISYTYLALVVATFGLGGGLLAPTLVGYGLAGLGGVTWTGRRLDVHPTRSAASVGVALTLGLAALAASQLRGVGIVAVLLWGAGAAALPVVLQAAALRVAGTATSTASGAYVVAYQVGISTGSALGAVLVDLVGTRALPMTSALVTAVGIPAMIVVVRRAWRPTSQVACDGLA